MQRRLVTVTILVGTVLLVITACATPKPEPQPTLLAPAGTNPAAVAAMQEGNKLFAEGRWGAALTQYKIAIQAQPDMGEAHYNLALALEQLGENGEARERRHDRLEDRLPQTGDRRFLRGIRHGPTSR